MIAFYAFLSKESKGRPYIVRISVSDLLSATKPLVGLSLNLE